MMRGSSFSLQARRLLMHGSGFPLRTRVRRRSTCAIRGSGFLPADAPGVIGHAAFVSSLLLLDLLWSGV